jgi:3-dehydroquinate synthase
LAEVRVAAGGGAYSVLICDGLLDEAGALAAEWGQPGDGLAVVTDSNVWGRYGDRLSAAMGKAGLDFGLAMLEPGEGAKSLAGLEQLYSAFARMRLKRGGLVVAFGGGVVGDLAGFAAATWMRGVKYIQMPTTLLAQVDSSVGGKTAININEGKNLAGVFWQPALVIADPGLLKSLPPREFRCGMAEVIKYGAIRSEKLLASAGAFGRGGKAGAAGMIWECCRIKAEIVGKDEFDTGERMLLNFGHSFGHAIEKLGGYSSHNHGEAVAMGMCIAAETGEKLGLTEYGTATKLREALALQGLDTESPYLIEEILPQMALDKKNRGGAMRLVMLGRIGEAFVHGMEYEELERTCKARA